jgi:hypothetical protein
MQEIAETARDSRRRRRLAVALDGSGAFRRFVGVIADDPAQRERWVGFRGERTPGAGVARGTRLGRLATPS